MKKNTSKDFEVTQGFFTGQEAKTNKKEIDNINIPYGYVLKKETKSQRLQFLVRPAINKALDQEAKSIGISKNELVNRIFEEYLNLK